MGISLPRELTDTRRRTYLKPKTPLSHMVSGRLHSSDALRAVRPTRTLSLALIPDFDACHYNLLLPSYLASVLLLPLPKLSLVQTFPSAWIFALSWSCYIQFVQLKNISLWPQSFSSCLDYIPYDLFSSWSLFTFTPISANPSQTWLPTSWPQQLLSAGNKRQELTG